MSFIIILWFGTRIKLFECSLASRIAIQASVSSVFEFCAPQCHEYGGPYMQYTTIFVHARKYIAIHYNIFSVHKNISQYTTIFSQCTTIFLSAQQYFLSAQQYFLSAQQCIFSVHNNIFSVHNNIFSVHNNIFSVHNNIFSVHNNIFSVHNNVFSQCTTIFSQCTTIFSQCTTIFSQCTTIFSQCTDIFFDAPIFFSMRRYFFRSADIFVDIFPQLYTVYLAMDEILKDYFVKGFLYQKILQLLEKFHGINISMRTLQQRLNSLGLKRKKIDYINREEVRAAIVSYCNGAGSSGGYRSVWHAL